MITKLEVSNFKSIKHASLDLKRINILIGAPNTGKSNILECLSFFSSAYYRRFGSAFREFVRHEKTADLFYDADTQNAVDVITQFDDKTANRFILSFNNGGYQAFLSTSQGGTGASMGGDQQTLSNVHIEKLGEEFLGKYKFYKYVDGSPVGGQQGAPLLPPSGSNLMSVLITEKEIRNLITRLIAPSGLRLGLRVKETKIELIRESEDVIISYPFEVLSDTFKRLMFFLAAILTNKKSILIFEEPESHAFPYYAKYLAEKIVSDRGENQYFMSTHNPYFLQAAVARANKDEIAVFVTRYKEYQTSATRLSDEDMGLLVEADADVFFQLDRFVGSSDVT